MKVIVKVKVNADCYELISRLPRGYEYELLSEDYNEDGSGTVHFAIYDESDLTSAMELALDTNDGVESYTVIETGE